MTAVLVVLPPPAAAGEAGAEWALVEAGAVRAEGEIAPGETFDPPPGRAPARAVAILPAEDVFVRRMSVPGRSERDVRRAAPFLIEEHLAQPLEAAEVVVGPPMADGRRWIVAIDRAAHARWRRLLAGFGVKPVHAVPDAMLLSGHGGDLTVAGHRGVVLFQTRSGDLAAARHDQSRQAEPSEVEAEAATLICGGIEEALAANVLPAIGARVRPRRLLISEDVDPRLIAPDSEPIALKRQPTPDLRLSAAAIDPGVFAALPSIFGDALASQVDWADLFRPWRTAAGLALAAALGAAALNAGQAAYYQARADAYADAEIAAFRETFPEVTRVVDARAQLDQRLAALGGRAGGSDFLQLSAALADIVGETDTVRIDSVRYDVERGTLSVSALYSGFGDFEVLRAAAQTRGVTLEDGGARQSETGVAGDFTVRLP